MSNSSSSSRFRNFATIVYPDSVCPNWLDVLSELKIPCFVSPLHDEDVNPDGEIKKAHFHIIFCFEGKKSVEQVQDIVKSFGGVGVEVCNSLRGYARYLCHLDNPEKHQYSPSDVLCFGGADYSDIIGLPTDRIKAIIEMTDFCRENRITSYADLFDYCKLHRLDWLRVLIDNGTFVIKEYLKSLSWEIARSAVSSSSSSSSSSSDSSFVGGDVDE